MGLYFLLLLTIVLAVICIFALFAAFTGKGKHRKVADRLAEIRTAKSKEEIVPVEKKRRNWFLKMLMEIGALILPGGGAHKKLEYKLYSAGIYSDDAVLIYLGLRIFVPFALLLLVLLFSPFYVHNFKLLIIIPVGALLVGIVAPVMTVGFMTRKRKKEFLLGFPDALDLIAVCTEAGVGFDSAILKVAEELEFTHMHIAKEFQTYLYEQQVGIDKHEALRNLARRMDIDIVNAFISVLIQSDKLGTGIVQTLRVYSDSLRTQRRQTAEIKAARRPIYLIFPLMFLILPSMFLVILGPAAMNIAKAFK